MKLVHLKVLAALLVLAQAEMRVQNTCPMMVNELDPLQIIDDKYVGFHETFDHRYHSLLYMQNRNGVFEMALNDKRQNYFFGQGSEIHSFMNQQGYLMMHAQHIQYENLNIVIEYSSSIKAEAELHEVLDGDYRIEFIRVSTRTIDEKNAYVMNIIAVSKVLEAQMLHNDHQRTIHIEIDAAQQDFLLVCVFAISRYNNFQGRDDELKSLAKQMIELHTRPQDCLMALQDQVRLAQELDVNLDKVFKQDLLRINCTLPNCTVKQLNVLSRVPALSTTQSYHHLQQVGDILYGEIEPELTDKVQLDLNIQSRFESISHDIQIDGYSAAIQEFHFVSNIKLYSFIIVSPGNPKYKRTVKSGTPHIVDSFQKVQKVTNAYVMVVASSELLDLKGIVQRFADLIEEARVDQYTYYNFLQQEPQNNTVSEAGPPPPPPPLDGEEAEETGETLSVEQPGPLGEKPDEVPTKKKNAPLFERADWTDVTQDEDSLPEEELEKSESVEPPSEIENEIKDLLDDEIFQGDEEEAQTLHSDDEDEQAATYLEEQDEEQVSDELEQTERTEETEILEELQEEHVEQIGISEETSKDVSENEESDTSEEVQSEGSEQEDLGESTDDASLQETTDVSNPQSEESSSQDQSDSSYQEVYSYSEWEEYDPIEYLPTEAFSGHEPTDSEEKPEPPPVKKDGRRCLKIRVSKQETFYKCEDYPIEPPIIKKNVQPEEIEEEQAEEEQHEEEQQEKQEELEDKQEEVEAHHHARHHHHRNHEVAPLIITHQHIHHHQHYHYYPHHHHRHHHRHHKNQVKQVKSLRTVSKTAGQEPVPPQQPQSGASQGPPQQQAPQQQPPQQPPQKTPLQPPQQPPNQPLQQPSQPPQTTQQSSPPSQLPTKETSAPTQPVAAPIQSDEQIKQSQAQSQPQTQLQPSMQLPSILKVKSIEPQKMDPQEPPLKQKANLGDLECFYAYSECNYRGVSLKLCGNNPRIPEQIMQFTIKSYRLPDGVQLNTFPSDNPNHPSITLAGNVECLEHPISMATD